MSKIIDLLATLGAFGITGYFIYRVILPNLKDIQLPSFQFQQPPSFTGVPAEIPQIPTEEPTPPQEDTTGGEEPQQSTPTSAPSAPPISAGLVYDSNTHGKWNNGQKRTVNKDGNTGPNGKGFQTSASGNPTFIIDGNGVGHLQTSGSGTHGRIYVFAKNYNSRLEGNMMFETATIDNISMKTRSRHGTAGHPSGGSGCPCGGVGAGIHRDGSIDLKIETCHGTNVGMGNGKAPPFQLGKWYKFSFSVWDGAGGSVNSKLDIDGKTVATGKVASTTSSCKDRALYNQDSYFWLRINNTSGTARAGFSNIRLYELGSGQQQQQTLMLRYYPYLYNSFNNRRRL